MTATLSLHFSRAPFFKIINRVDLHGARVEIDEWNRQAAKAAGHLRQGTTWTR